MVGPRDLRGVLFGFGAGLVSVVSLVVEVPADSALDGVAASLASDLVAGFTEAPFALVKGTSWITCCVCIGSLFPATISDMIER